MQTVLSALQWDGVLLPEKKKEPRMHFSLPLWFKRFGSYLRDTYNGDIFRIYMKIKICAYKYIWSGFLMSQKQHISWDVIYLAHSKTRFTHTSIFSTVLLRRFLRVGKSSALNVVTSPSVNCVPYLPALPAICSAWHKPLELWITLFTSIRKK